MVLRFLGIAALALTASTPGLAQNSAPAAPPAVAPAGVDNNTQTEDVRFQHRFRRPDDGSRAAVGDGPLPLPDRYGRGSHRDLGRARRPPQLCEGRRGRAAQHRGRVADYDREVPSLELTRKEVRNIQAPLLRERLHGRRRDLGRRFAALPARAVRFRGEHALDRPFGRSRFPRRAGDHRRPGSRAATAGWWSPMRRPTAIW